MQGGDAVSITQTEICTQALEHIQEMMRNHRDGDECLPQTTIPTPAFQAMMSAIHAVRTAHVETEEESPSGNEDGRT